MCIRDVAPLSMIHTLRTTHTMSAMRSIVPRMPPPMYITISVSWFKSLLEHERQCLSGRYRTQPASADPQGPSGFVRWARDFSQRALNASSKRSRYDGYPAALLFYDKPEQLRVTATLSSPRTTPIRQILCVEEHAGGGAAHTAAPPLYVAKSNK